MFRYLLVPSTGSELDRPVVETALRAADPSSAHIAFLHVRMDVKQVMVMLAGSGMTLGTGLVGLEQEANEHERLAREAFRAFCTEYKLNDTDARDGGLSASWTMETGELPACLARRARVADAIVLGRGEQGDLLASGALAHAVLEAGRPVLIAPCAPVPEKLNRTLAIAWKDRPEAARAVTAAIAADRRGRARCHPVCL
jgi:nucleotide-binding universal stress UspA family protein